MPLIYGAANPVNNIAAGAPRFDAAAIRAVIGAGKGRMPAFPHLTATDVDALATFLTTSSRSARTGPRWTRWAGNVRRAPGARSSDRVRC